MKRLFPIGLFLFFVTSCATPTTTPSANATPTIHIIFPTPASCTSIAAAPTPGPDEPSVFPPITEQDHIRGADHPILTVTDYIDYQDPRSALFVEGIRQLVEEHPKEVRWVSRTFPLISINDKAAIAAQAAEAAAEQNKFWEVHDLLFTQQANWIALPVADFEQWITAQASGLGLNVEQFQSDMKRDDIVARVNQAWEQGQKMGLPGTPLILLNGQIYGGPRDYSSLNDILQLILLGKRQFTACPAVTVQMNKQYIAALHTEKGDVKIQ